MGNRNKSCLIVGAGMAGLVAARSLAGAGWEVVMLDEGRGVGGRMATRRIGGAVCDHGAQFFTVRDERFGRMVGEWVGAGVAREWCRGFGSGDGYPRYCGAGGMTTIARHLARGLDVRTAERVVSADARDGGWVVRVEGGAAVEGAALILTPPVPQSLALLDAGGFALGGELRLALAAIEYDPCLAVMAVLDGPSRVPPPGGVKLAGEPLDWVGDNTQKGISPAAPAVTIHAGPQFSRAHWETESAEVARLLLAAAAPWIGAAARETQVHRWRYSQPIVTRPEPCLVAPGPPPLVCAGDAFGGPRVEGAALSGLAAADAVKQIRP